MRYETGFALQNRVLNRSQTYLHKTGYAVLDSSFRQILSAHRHGTVVVHKDGSGLPGWLGQSQEAVDSAGLHALVQSNMQGFVVDLRHGTSTLDPLAESKTN